MWRELPSTEEGLPTGIGGGYSVDDGPAGGADRGRSCRMPRSMIFTTRALDRDALVRAAASVEVHTLPIPMTQASMFDFGQTSVSVEGVYLSAAAWLHESEYELVP